MKRELFRCDYCEIQKFDSQTQNYINLPFVSDTLAQWKQHITRPKHNMNIARNENLVDDLVIECNHCNGRFTIEQYKHHKAHNVLLWVSNNPIYKDCSCNNFVYNNKRFEDLNVLRAYAESRYENGRKKYEYIPKQKVLKSFADRGKAIINNVQEKEKKRVVRQPPIEEKIIKENPITMTIEDEYNKLNNIKDKNQDKNDYNIKPIWDSEDICCECGLNTNVWREYPIEKLKKWEVKLCECEEDTASETDEDEKII